MSRAKAVADRNERDFYATPATLAEAICCSLAAQNQWPCIVEPSAGSGPFVRAARAAWPKAQILALDIAPQPDLADAGADAMLPIDWLDFVGTALHPGEPMLVVGNPPYRDAEELIRAALGWMRDGDALAFLLRLNFLGSSARVPMWQRPGLLSVQTVTPRPSFTNGGTDGTEYAVFVWQKGYTGTAALLPPLVWRTSNRRAA